MVDRVFDVESYLQKKAVHVKHRQGDEVNITCFFHGEDPGKRGRLYVNVGQNPDFAGLYMCQVCGAKGNLVTLMRWFGDEAPRPDKEDNRLDPAVRNAIYTAAAEYYASSLGVEEFKWLQTERGLTTATIKKHQIGWADGRLWPHLKAKGYKLEDVVRTGLVIRKEEQVKEGEAFVLDGKNVEIYDFLRNCITIPYHITGNVVLIRGKKIGGKYLTPPGQESRLFNSDVTWDAPEVIVTEGEFDALVVEQMGYRAVGVAGANTWQDTFTSYLSDARKVYLVFDNDKAGAEGAAKVKEAIGRKARIVEMPDGGLPPGDNDISEHFGKRGHDPAEFEEMIRSVRAGMLVTVHEAIEAWEFLQGVGGLKTGYEKLDFLLEPGLLPGQVCIPLAKTNCLAGDTVLKVNRGGATFDMELKDLVHKFNGGSSGHNKVWDLSIPTRVQRDEGGLVKLVDIQRAWASGKKKTYTVTTSSGRQIRSTLEHPFLTPSGQFKKLGELSVGDSVMLNVGRSSNGRAKVKPYRQKSGLRAHPYATRRNLSTGGWSVQMHRVVVEADLNNMSFDAFVKVCQAGPVDGLKFIDPDTHEAHHVDGDTQNNDLSNLELQSKSDHRGVEHAENVRNVLERTGPEVIVSIEFYGEEDTYDIEVVDDPHNFIANEFVVHNTGKTVHLLNLFHRMKMAKPDIKILFCSLEQTPADWFERSRRIYSFYNMGVDLRDVNKMTAKYWQDNLYMTGVNRMSEEDLIASVDDYQLETGSKPDVVAIDYLGYWAQSFAANSRYERVSDAVMSLKACSKDMGIPVISPHQVSRGAEFGSEPDLSDARDSGAIEETADFVFGMWNEDTRKGVNPEDRKGEVNLRIIKSRHGGKGHKITMQFGYCTLVMAPHEDPSATAFARDELLYAARGESWEDAMTRHKTGKKDGELLSFTV